MHVPPQEDMPPRFQGDWKMRIPNEFVSPIAFWNGERPAATNAAHWEESRQSYEKEYTRWEKSRTESPCGVGPTPSRPPGGVESSTAAGSSSAAAAEEPRIKSPPGGHVQWVLRLLAPVPFAARVVRLVRENFDHLRACSTTRSATLSRGWAWTRTRAGIGTTRVELRARPL